MKPLVFTLCLFLLVGCSKPSGPTPLINMCATARAEDTPVVHKEEKPPVTIWEKGHRRDLVPANVVHIHLIPELFNQNPVAFAESFKRVRLIGHVDQIDKHDGNFTLHLYRNKIAPGEDIAVNVRDTEQSRLLVSQLDTTKWEYTIIDCHLVGNGWNYFDEGRIIAVGIKDYSQIPD
jgi:hypothetical protein